MKSDGTAPPCGFRVEGTARKVISKVGVAVGAPRHFVQSNSCSRAGGLRTVAVEREGLRAMESEKGAMEGGEIVKRMMQRCNETSEKVINRRVGLYVRSE